MGRRTFSPEFKLEAVKLIRERGITVRQAAKDLGLHENMLHRWVRDHRTSGQQAFPGRGRSGRPRRP
jgi:transposase